MRILRRLLLVTLGLSGAVVAARAAFGPLRAPFPVRSPLVAEGVCALAATLLLVFPEKRPPALAAAARPRWGLLLALCLVVTATCVSISLSFPLVCDEYVLAAQGRAMDWRAARACFVRPGADRFFRPLADVSLRLDALWSGVPPWGWHIFGILLHLANTALVFVLARRLFRRPEVAFWAAMLFGIHGSRHEAVAFLARFDQLATGFVLLALLLFERYLESGSRVAFAASHAAMLAALLSKESAYVFPLLAAWMLAWVGRIPRSARDAHVPQRVFFNARAAGPGGPARTWGSAPLRLLGFFSITAVVFVYRWVLLGGIGGYPDSASGRPAILNIRPLALLKALTLRLWGLLYFPVNWSHQPEPWLAALLALAVAALLWLVWRPPAHHRALGFAAAFTLLASLPVAHMLLIGADLRGAAHLYLPSVGFCWLLGAALDGARAPALAIVVFQIAALWHNLLIWDRTSQLAADVCRMATREALRAGGTLVFLDPPRILDGIAFYTSGLPECVSVHAPGRSVVVAFGPKLPIAAPGTPVFAWNHGARRFEPASLPQLKSAVGQQPVLPPAPQDGVPEKAGDPHQKAQQILHRDQPP